MNKKQISKRLEFYRHSLFEDILPFWLHHSRDAEHGGFLVGLDRDGSIIETDKPMWIQARFVWVLSRIYSDFRMDSEYLRTAEDGLSFILKHGFDNDGRMFYRVTRTGEPLVKRRYFFTETFTIIALAAFGRASENREYVEKAYTLFLALKGWIENPLPQSSKFIRETREMKGFSLPMILIATVQELRLADTERKDEYDDFIDGQIREIQNFMNYEQKCLMETIGPEGFLTNHFEGRILNPGHAIEASWFLLRESNTRGGDPFIRDMGLLILDWMWEWGWDRKYGGIFYFKDSQNQPSSEYWHDMKFWWPHNEAVIATLMAYEITGNKKYLKMYNKVHKWSHSHFPDKKYGEWFGYLHRDGTVSSEVKGNMFKGPFHIPRMQMYAIEILESILKKR
ncbi:MAG: AGE family epimerase/isomerase [Spirochaetales bacterium]|nr:AGE family epimerase/isomerase [Spirochaetales bacterium]